MKVLINKERKINYMNKIKRKLKYMNEIKKILNYYL